MLEVCNSEPYYYARKLAGEKFKSSDQQSFNMVLVKFW